MSYVKKSKFIFAITIAIAIVIAFLLSNKVFSVNNAKKGTFKENVEELISSINAKKLLDKNFDPDTINNKNIEDILNISNDNYSSISVTSREDKVFISIVGKGQWKDLVACGSIDNLKVVDSSSDECNEDYIAPEIKLIGESSISISAGSNYSDLGVIATDNKDGDLTDKMKVDNDVNTNIPGRYTVTYSVSDSSSNDATITRTILVVDDKGPIVNFKNDSTVVTVSDEHSHVEVNSLKYLWTTSTNAPIESNFKLSFTNGEMINVPTNVSGIYYLWVLAKDSVGNTTITRSNSFNLSSKAPIIALNGDTSVSISVGSIYTDKGAIAIDDIDGNITSKIVTVGNVNTNILGAYTITYTVKDSDNNISSMKRIVNVIDNTLPIIKFETNGNSIFAKSHNTKILVSDEHSSIDTNSLKYKWTTSVTKPNEDSFNTSFINNESVSTPAGVTGTYYLWVFAKDSVGNTLIERTNVFNLDNTASVITLNGNNIVEVDEGAIYTDLGATATDNIDGNISVIASGSVNPNVIGTYTVTYTAMDSLGNEAELVVRTVNVKSPANAPVLATGMTPIKWNGTSWVDTVEDDSEWYRYDKTDKKWANARTADGSMWVWIPRYIYKISSGWHSSTVGTIDVQFTKDTSDNWNRLVIGNINEGTTAETSNGTWTNHPAFTFGSTELTGIWVAKFEASGATNAVDSKPNVTSLRNITIDSMFTSSRNMETNSRYGWGTSGGNIDTHMMKNSEWGAIAYLSQSIYGKIAEIWMNNSRTFTTGCAGTSVSAAGFDGCEYAYDTANGQQASTTGNIYGIYDMSGGAWEYTSSYVDNGHTNLTTNGNSIIQAPSKYKDVYTIGATDTADDNYNLTINSKGDAVYETSTSGTGQTTWYGNYSYIPNDFGPWFTRGGDFNNSGNTAAGTFNFDRLMGIAHNNGSFRSVVLVGSGL